MENQTDQMRFTSLFLLTFSLFQNNLTAQTPAEITMDSLRLEYIRKYKDIAMDEMEHSGIPASIRLAQGILESRAGTSELALKANNHFGIKCGKDWTGKSYHKHDDEFNKKGQPVNSCFRKYNNVVDCYADHSKFILNPDKNYRYGFLFDLDPLDYKAWAKGLQEAGYSVAGHYAERLIYFIELYQLNRYDQLTLEGRTALKRMAEVNGVRMVQARAGETLLDISKLYNLPVEKITAYNDNRYSPQDAPGLGAWVFIQEKNETWSGTEIFHSVEPEQDLFDIAQRYGLRLESLRKRNNLQPGQEPLPYEFIRLQGVQGLGEKIAIRPTEQPTKKTQAKSPILALPEKRISTSSGRIVVEMLPAENLEAPVPVSELLDATVDSEAGNLPAAAAPQESQPEIIINTATGETLIYHTVQKGDTLYKIARRFDVSPERIRKLNKMTDNIIRAGQILRVF